MPFSAYDIEAIRLLSKVLAEVNAQVGQGMSAAELAAVERAVTRKLIEAYDGGERDPDALKRAGAAGLVGARWKGLAS